MAITNPPKTRSEFEPPCRTNGLAAVRVRLLGADRLRPGALAMLKRSVYRFTCSEQRYLEYVGVEKLFVPQKKAGALQLSGAPQVTIGRVRQLSIRHCALPDAISCSQASAPPNSGRTRVIPYFFKMSAARALEASFGQVQKRTISRSRGISLCRAASSLRGMRSAP